MSKALFQRAAAGSRDARSAGTQPAERIRPAVVDVMRELGFELVGPSAAEA